MAVLTETELTNLVLDRLQANVASDGAFTTAEIRRHLNEAYADMWEVEGGAIKRVAGGTLWTPQPTTGATGILTTVLTDVNEVREVFETASSASTGDATAGDVALTPVDLSEIIWMRQNEAHFGSYLTAKVYAVTRNFGSQGGANPGTEIRPDADVTDGTWLNASGNNTDLFRSVNEAYATDADYIETPANSNSTCEVGLGDLGITPGGNSVIVVRFRARVTATATLTVSLIENATSRASSTPTLTTSLADYNFALTAAEVATISDWDDLRLRFATSSASGGGQVRISWAALAYSPEVNMLRLDVWPSRASRYYPTHYIPNFEPLTDSITTPNLSDLGSRDMGLLAAARMAPLTGRAEFVPSILADLSTRTQAAMERKLSALMAGKQDR